MFQLLGRIGVSHGGGLSALPSGQPSSIAAMLLLEPGRTVSTQRIMDVLTPDRSAAKRPTANSVQAAVTKLRRFLENHGGHRVVHDVGGYKIVSSPDDVDVHQLRTLFRSAQMDKTADPAAALTAVRAALDLQVGEPLAGASNTPGMSNLRTKLLEELLNASELKFELQITLGGYSEAVPELVDFTRLHPQHEGFHALLVRALYGAGRQHEALDHLNHVRRLWADDFGLDPSPALEALRLKVLRADDALTPSTPTAILMRSDARADPVAVPHQLPAARPVFTGRKDELTWLDESIRPGRVCVVSGQAGVGKTWLIAEWARRRHNDWPDGVLHVDLRGFDPSSKPLTPAEALRAMLISLGHSASTVPDTPEGLVASYRCLTAGKRLLILLDNARDTEQVDPLLPAGGNATLVVTSRRQLTGLVTTHAAKLLTVEPLDDDGARRLLENLLHDRRVTARPEVVTELAAWCNGIPLALSIIAAKAATHPKLSLDHILPELREASSRLDVFDSTDLRANLRAVLSCSEQALAGSALTAFRLLAIAPGPDTGLPGTAALLGVPKQQAAALLRDLEAANLVEQRVHGRYEMHNLVRLYATEQAELALAPDLRHDALHRIIAFYVLTAEQCERLLEPHRVIPTSVDRPPGCTPLAITSQADALTWFDSEQHCLASLPDATEHAGLDVETLHVAWSLDTYQQRRGLRENHVAIWRKAVDAAKRIGPSHETAALRRLGTALHRNDNQDEAARHLATALDLAEASGDLLSLAHAHYSISNVLDAQGSRSEALRHTIEAERIYAQLGHRVYRAMAMNANGWRRALLGDTQAGRDLCEQALAMQFDDPEGQAATLDSLGEIASLSGDHHTSIQHYDQALVLRRQLGNTYEVARTLSLLGDAHSALGNSDKSHEMWLAALDLYTAQQRHPEAEALRQRLT